MGKSHGPQDDHNQPPGAATKLAEARTHARALSEAAREMRAQAHHMMETTRQLRKHNEEIVGHMQACRERQAELGGPSPAPPPRTAVKLLLIDDNPADVGLFRHALKQCGLGCEVRVLRHGSDVTEVVRQAATAAPLFQPQLIIVEYRIPGMELEELVAALRTVPAYQRVPIMLFSTLPEAEGQRRCAQCGATAFVQKPGEWQAFGEAVATMVRRWSGPGGGADVTPAHSQ